MDRNLAIICILTFIIHLIGTLAYAVRIAGVRTGRIAVTMALFNILVLVSRTSNSFQGTFLAKRVESNLLQPTAMGMVADFRWLLLSATLATVVGALLIPTFQRFFSKAVTDFQSHRSMPRLLLHICFRSGIGYLKDSVSVPVSGNVRSLNTGRTVSWSTIILNGVAISLWSTGVFASLYAGYLKPELRVTSNSLSSIVNGLATILMFVIIDPQISVMTDDVTDGKLSESSFRRAIVWLVGSRLAGTLLAQVLLVPAAGFIVLVAEWM